jgi:hypothetical protein
MARHHRRNTQNNMDRATEFLTGKPGLDFCDECVREALGTTRANLTEKDLHTNAVTVGLSRAPGLCSSCGKQDSHEDAMSWPDTVTSMPDPLAAMRLYLYWGNAG